MKTFRKVMNLVPLMILWLMMSTFVWGWIFTFLTDAPREEKIVLFIECDVPGDTYIASKLEEHPSEAIHLAFVKPFSYSMMSSEAIRTSDLYIVSESGFQEYFEWFVPLPEEAMTLGEIFEYEDIPYGIKVFDSQMQSGVLSDFISYEDENYCLVFGKESVHMENGEAVSFARHLLNIR